MTGKLKFIIRLIPVFLVLILSTGNIYAADQTLDGVKKLGTTIVNGNTKANNYFYMQLNSKEQKFYHALEKMAGVKSCDKEHICSQDNAEFLKGNNLTLTGDTANGQLYKLENSDFSVGQNQLLSEMAAAKDAFQYDHPEVFYIDWDYLSLRVYQKNDRSFEATLGTGRSDSYYLQGFNKDNVTDEIDRFNSKLSTAVDEIKAKANENQKTSERNSTKDLNRLKAKAAHDYMTENMVYRYEHEVYNFNHSKDSNKPYSNARTAYDALIFHEGVCEAYTRAYKAIMDELDIPTICVTGIYRTEDGIAEQHIWNYVELDDPDPEKTAKYCFLVDTTMDDPIYMKAVYKYGDRKYVRERCPEVGSKIVDDNGTLLHGQTKDQATVSGLENEGLCLVGYVKTMTSHVPSAFLSGNSKTFGYPNLIQDGLGEGQTFSKDGFQIRLIPDSVEGESSTGAVFLVSYNQMNYTENADRGQYIICRWRMKDPRSGEYKYSNWCYPMIEWYQDERGSKETEFEPSEEYGEMGHVLRFPLPQVEWMQFAITDQPPEYCKYRDDLVEASKHLNDLFFYQGDPKSLSILSPEVTNTYDIYKAPPYVIKSTPEAGGTLDGENTKYQHIEITYDDQLVKKGESYLDKKELSSATNINYPGDFKMNVYKEYINGVDAEYLEPTNIDDKIKNLKIETVKIETNDTWHSDGSVQTEQINTKDVTKISFDFMPDIDYASQDALYNFQPDGLVGFESGKQANGVGYYFSYPVSCCSVLAERYGWSVFGQPQLLDSSLFNPENNEIKTQDDSPLGLSEDFFEKITHRFQLVVDEPLDKTIDNKNEKETLEEQLKEQKVSDGILQTDKTSFYNIRLSLCKKMIIKTGQKVKVCVGFPKGYNYDSFTAGTTFKAYHYNPVKDKNGKETGDYTLEEINCEVTPLGLIIECESFSPFAVVPETLNETAKMELNSKTQVNIIEEGEGKVNYDNNYVGENGIITLNSNETKEFTIQPKDSNYVIDELKVDGIPENLSNKRNEATISITGANNKPAVLIEASFIPKEEFEKEQGRDDSVQSETVTEADITATLPTGSIKVQPGDTIEIPVTNAEIKNYSLQGKVTYIWEKDSKVVQSGPNKDLIIPDASSENAGNYQLSIRYQVGEQNITKDIGTVTVSVPAQKQTGKINIDKDVSNGHTVLKDFSNENNQYPIGSTVEIEAVSDQGYSFKCWKINCSESDIKTNPLVITVSDEEKTYEPVFEQRSIDINVTSTEGGSVLIDGNQNSKSCNLGSYVTLKAVTNSGFKFVGWKVKTDNDFDRIVSKTPEYQFKVTDNSYKDYQAAFEKIETIKITVGGHPEAGGTAYLENNLNEKQYNLNDMVNLHAKPNDGYEFAGWYYNGEGNQEILVSDQPNYSFTLKQEPDENLKIPNYEITHYVAFFKAQSLKVNTSVSPANSGTIKVEGEQVTNGYVTLTPQPNSGYEFVQFKVNGEVRKENPLYFELSKEPVDIVAEFTQTGATTPSTPTPTPTPQPQEPENQYLVSTKVTPANSGKVTGGGFYNAGSKVTLKATAKEGYEFSNWSLNGKQVSSDPNLSITVTDNAVYEAVFKEKEVQGEVKKITLDSNLYHLSTVKGGTTSQKISIKTDPEEYKGDINWDNLTPTVIEIEGNPKEKEITVNALATGEATLRVTAGEVSQDIKVDVSNEKLISDGIQVEASSPDYFKVTVKNVNLNTAAGQKEGQVNFLPIFTWSESNQSDINVKNATKVAGTNNWVAEFPVNNTEVNNYYMKAGKIFVHAYASTNPNTMDSFVGGITHDWADLNPAVNDLIGSGYAQDIGFIHPAVTVNGATIGTTGQCRQLEGIRLSTPVDGVDLTYSVHAADIGWKPYVNEGEYAGTMHENRQLEAIKIKLTGKNASNYKVEYRAHCADIGWTNWVSDNQIAGTTGEARRMEAIEVRVVPR